MSALTAGFKIKGTLIWKWQHVSKPYQCKRIPSVTTPIYTRVQALKFAPVICCCGVCKQIHIHTNCGKCNLKCLPVYLSQTWRVGTHSVKLPCRNRSGLSTARGCSCWDDFSNWGLLLDVSDDCHFLIYDSSSRMLHSVTISECLYIVSLGRVL